MAILEAEAPDSAPADDLDQLAQQHGGESLAAMPAASAPAAELDLDALAKKHGGESLATLPSQKPTTIPDDWKREDGSTKGLGYLGLLKRPDGGVTSELTIGVPINGKEMDIPTFVPTLTKQEVTSLLTWKEGDKIPAAIIKKASDYAKQRLAKGQSVFAQDGEQQSLYPELERSSKPSFLGGSADLDVLAKKYGGEAIATLPTAAAPADLDALAKKYGAESVSDDASKVDVPSKSELHVAAQPSLFGSLRERLSGVGKEVSADVKSVIAKGAKAVTAYDRLGEPGAQDAVLADAAAHAKAIAMSPITGTQQAYRGVQAIQPFGTSGLTHDEQVKRVKSGVSDIIEGMGTALTIPMGIAVASNPIAAARVVVKSYLAGKTGKQAAKILGGDPDTQRLVEDVSAAAAASGLTAQEVGRLTAEQLTNLAERGRAARAEAGVGFENAKPAGRGASGRILEATVPTAGDIPEVGGTTRMEATVPPPAPVSPAAPAAPVEATTPSSALASVSLRALDEQIDATKDTVDKLLEAQQRIEDKTPGASLPANRTKLPLSDQAALSSIPKVAATLAELEKERARRGVASPQQFETWVKEAATAPDSIREASNADLKTLADSKDSQFASVAHAELMRRQYVGEQGPSGVKTPISTPTTAITPNAAATPPPEAIARAVDQEPPAATAASQGPAGTVAGLALPELEARVQQARAAGRNDVGAELELQKQRDAVEQATGKPVGPVSVVAEAPKGVDLDALAEKHGAVEGEQILSDTPDLDGHTTMTGERVREFLGVEPKEALSRGWIAREENGQYRLIQNRPDLQPKQIATSATAPAVKGVAEKPTATFLGYQPTAEGGAFPLYNVAGGPLNRSTVSAEKLTANGIAVPETPSIEDWKKNRKAPEADAERRDLMKQIVDAHQEKLVNLITAKAPAEQVAAARTALEQARVKLAQVPTEKKPVTPQIVPESKAETQPRAYDRDVAQKTFKQFRTALTKATNAAKVVGLSPEQQVEKLKAVIAEADKFSAYYEDSAEPWPDSHHDWVRAKDDAEFAIQRLKPSVVGTAMKGGKKPVTPQVEAPAGSTPIGIKPTSEEKIPAKKLADYKPGEEVIYTDHEGTETRGTVLDPALTGDKDKVRLELESTKTSHGAAFDRVEAHEGDVKSADKTHDYSSTQVNLDGDLKAKVLALGKKIPKPDLAPDGLETTPHVTVKYGLHALGRDEITDKFKGTEPFDVTLGAAGYFHTDDGDVLFIKAESPELRALNQRIAELPNSDEHPEYKPHITIAYLKKGKGKNYVEKSIFDSLKGQTFKASTVTTTLATGKVWNTDLLDNEQKALLGDKDTKADDQAELPATVEGRKVGEEDEGQADRGGAGTGQLPEPRGGAADAERAGREGPLATVPAEDVGGTEGAGAQSARPRGKKSRVADRVPRGAGASGESGIEQPAGRGDVQESVDVSPSGATHYPGHKAPDYDLDDARIDAVINRGPVVRAEDNLAAIKLVKQLAAEERYATPDEQAVLAKYVGWGASDMAHRLNDQPRWDWSENEKRIWQELQDALTPEERKGLLASTPYAHFTYRLFKPMWTALENAGFGGGRVLEPSVGTGHAFGFMPPEIRVNSTLNGVEIEPITAAIAHHLYPSARIQPVGYEQARIARGTQDIIIGNPPFGDFGVKDARMPEVATRRIHNYFFAKALEHLRPGGLLMFVATHYAMDSIEASPLRRYLMERADFVGAVRLPSSAFGKSAKTEVITDMIVLRKLREGEKAKPLNAEAFIESPRHEGLSTIDYRGKAKNVYRSLWYEQHPELVLGTEAAEGTMYGSNQYTVNSEDSADEVLTKLTTALQSILPAGSYEAATAAETPTTTVVEGQYKTGEMRVAPGGKRIVKVDAHGATSDVTPLDKAGKVNKGAVDRLVGMIGIRDARNHAIAVMREKGSTEAEIKKAQRDLNRAYDSFVKPESAKPNYLNSLTNKRLFKEDPEAANLLALEKVEPKASLTVSPKDGKKVLRLSYTVVGKADIFTKRTVGAEARIEHVDTPKDALFASLGMQARIDWPYMARLHGSSILGLQRDLKNDGLVYEQPDGSYVLSDEYLSGDVVSKLEDVEAEHDPKRFAKNLEALKSIQPKAKTADDVMAGLVGIGIGSHWVPPEDLSTFVAEQLGVSPKNVRYSLLSTSTLTRWDGQYADQAVAAASRHALIVKYANGSKTYDFLDLVKDTLNLKRPELGHFEGSGKDRTWIREPQAELAAAANQELLRQAWSTFVLQHTEVLDRLLDIFNTRFNRTVERKYDGAHMQYPGMAQLTNSRGDILHFFPHQNNGVYRILTSGNTLLAHEVGAGKTFEMIAAAMEMRRTGRATKPMITVPTYLLAQWREDVIRLYPNARVLAFDDKDLSKDKRQQAMARIAHGDWDIVLVPHSSFGLLKVSNQRMVDVMNEWVVELESAITDAQKADTKEFERQKKRIQDKVDAKLKSLEDEKKDNALTWEQLGVDALFVDEAQAFKNLFFFTKINNMRGLSRSESDRALDLFVKIRDINEQSNFRNVVLATATPVMNTIGEIYTMQRYLQPDALRQNGVESFDNWYAMFARALPTTERQPDGNYKEVMRLRAYSNLPLLSKMMREVMDYIGWEDMPYLKLPKIKGGKINIIETEPHPMNPEAMKWFEDRMVALKETPPHINQHTGEYIAPDRKDMLTGQSLGKPDNILTVMTDAKKAAVDMRLIVGNRATDYKGSRIQKAADLMADYYRRSTDKKGVALMFLDMGTPKDPDPLTFLAGVTTEDETEGAMDEAAVEDADEVSFEDDTFFNLYDSLKAELVKRGVPAHEIAYIHQAKNAAERLALFQAANEGKVRFVFASTDKGGVGMNIQTRLGAMFEIDAPRAQRPGDLRQRMGRAIRQGNLYYDWGGVELYRFVTKGTTDEWLWGLLTTKDYQLRKFYKGEVGSITEDDPSTMSLEEAQIRATGDPRGVELTELKGRMARLEAQAMAGELAVSAAHGTIAKEKPRKAAWERDLKDLRAWLPNYEVLRGDKFSIVVDGKTYTKREDANGAIMSALETLLPKTPDRPNQYAAKTSKPVVIGKIGGLDIYAQDASFVGQIERKSSDGKKKESVNEDVWGTTLWIDADRLGLGSIEGGDVWTRDRKKPFGEGRNVISSLVNAYEKIPAEEGVFEEAIKRSTDAIAQSERVLANPPASVEALINARERVTAIETELKAESAAKDEARAAAKATPPPVPAPAPEKKGTTLQSTILPGAKELGEYVFEPAIEKLGEYVKTEGRWLRKLLAPDTVSAAAREGAAPLRVYLATRDQRIERARRILSKIEEVMDGWSQTESRRFWDVMEGLRHEHDLHPDTLAIADLFRDIIGKYTAAVTSRGLIENYLDNYWPHEWKPADKDTLGARLRRLFGRRPLAGPESFRKKRTIPTTREGLDAGLEPLSWNPATQLLRKITEMERSIMAHDFKLDMKAQGLYQFNPAGRKFPIPGWERVPDAAAGTVYGPKDATIETDEGVASGPLTFGRLIAGHYYAPADIVRIVENHLSPGLSGKSVTFDTYRRLGNAMNLVQLGFSAFHLWLTGLESVISKQALVFQMLSRGEFKEGALKQLEVGPQSILIDLRRGHEALKRFYANDANAKVLDDLIDTVVQGGGGFGWTLFEHEGAPKQFMKAIRGFLGAVQRGDVGQAARKIGKAAVTAPMAAIELPTMAIMEGWVPRLKMAAFIDMAEMEMRRLGPNPDINEARKVLSEVWDSVDNRFGQLRYNNLFWNNALKETLQASVRAVGWNVGTIREMFGAVPAQIGTLGRAATGGAGGKGGPPTIPMKPSAAGGDRFVPRGEALLHRKMAWLLSLLIIHGLAAAIYMYLRTGHGPEDSRDYWFPRSGEKDPATGRERRVKLIDYASDLYSWLHHPLTTAANKLQPLLTLIYEAVENKDYFNTEIRNADDPLVQQLKQNAEFAVKEVVPISYTNAERDVEEGASLKSKLVAMGKQAIRGVVPAPTTVERSAAENKLHEWGIADRGTRTQAQVEKSRLERQIREGTAARTSEGAEARQEAIAKGELSKRQIVGAIKSGARQQTYLQAGFKQLTLDRALTLYGIATPDERRQVRGLLAKKAKDDLKLAPPAERQELLTRFRAAMTLPLVNSQPRETP